MITSYAPGSPQSAIRVYDAAAFAAKDSADVAADFSHSHLLIRGGAVDSFWKWGLEALSVIRPIQGTVLNVQGEFSWHGGFIA